MSNIGPTFSEKLVTKDDYFYTRPHALVHPKIFSFGSVAIHINTEPYFIHESGVYTSFEQMHSPGYKPCLCVDSLVSDAYYVYNHSDGTLKRFKVSKNDKRICSTMDVNTYYKLINWMIKNIPCRNPRR